MFGRWDATGDAVPIQVLGPDFLHRVGHWPTRPALQVVPNRILTSGRGRDLHGGALSFLTGRGVGPRNPPPAGCAGAASGDAAHVRRVALTLSIAVGAALVSAPLARVECSVQGSAQGEDLAACEAALSGLLLAASYGVAAEETSFAPSALSRERLAEIRDLAERAEQLDLERLHLFAVAAFFGSLGEQVTAHSPRVARIARRGGIILEQHFFGGPPLRPGDHEHELAVLGTPDFLLVHLQDEPALFVQAQAGDYAFLELSHLLAPITSPGESSESGWFLMRGEDWRRMRRVPNPALSPRSRMTDGWVRRRQGRVQFLASEGETLPFPVLFLEYEPERHAATILYLSWMVDAGGELRLRRIAVDRIGSWGSLRGVYEIWDWKALDSASTVALVVDPSTVVRDQRFEPPRSSTVGERAILGLERYVKVVSEERSGLPSTEGE